MSVTLPPEAVALPASLAQQRLWLLDRLEPGTSAYNMGLAFRAPGALDAAVLGRVMDALAERHESLRTVFAAAEEGAAQVILPPGPVPLEVIDRPDLAPGDGEVDTLLAREYGRPYDLARGPLFRPALLRVRGASFVAFNLHHAVADEPSLWQMAREARLLYAAFAAGRPSPLPPPPLQYADFALWQREMLEAGEMDRQLAWWREAMDGVSGVLELPADRPRTSGAGWRGATRRVKLAPAVRDRLWALAREEAASPFTVLLALYLLLLARLAGEEEVVVGTPVSGRTPETEETVGFFVNTLALRGDLRGRPTFRALLGRVRDVARGALAHPDLPLERLVDALRLERDPTRTPLFQAMFVFATDGEVGRQAAAAEEEGEEGWTPVPVALGSARYELTLVVRDRGGEVEGTLDYATALFDAETVDRFAAAFRSLAEAAAEDPDRPAADLPLLPGAERARLLEGWSATAPAPAETVPVHRLFEAQAARTPDADAVVEIGGARLSYRALDARADAVARRLLAAGTRPEEVVGVVAGRTAAAVAALLGVLKAGAAYLPLDPALPAERGAALLADAGARRVVADAGEEALVRAWGAEPVSSAEEAGPAPRVETDPGRLAYVIYTSGSTGAPKGVMVPHGAVASFSLGFAELHGFAPGERVLVVPPLSFDASVGDLFPALLAGAALVFHPAPGELSGSALLELCRAEGITMADTAAALWGQWTDELARRGGGDPGPLRMVMMGGEAAALERAEAWAAATGRRVELVNHYGPTEATVCATLQKATDGAPWRGRAASLPIGRAVPGARVYVLDAAAEPLPPGARGELWIGGSGVARGYLGRPAATAERFLPDPFAGVPGARMYRTGDRVRWLPAGELEFLGRTDHQVKVRGYRIEPGEVEAALLALPGVREALVTVREDEPGRRRLVGYVAAPEDAFSAAEAREALRGRLPEYMVPAAFVRLDALPQTRHGKVDRRALPAPALPAPGEEHVEPRTATERALAELWAGVLGVERVGAEDDFFELGGHSLLALPLVDRVRERFGAEVPLRALFAAPTVAAMARAVDAVLAGEEAPGGDDGPRAAVEDARLADALVPAPPRGEGAEPRAVFLSGATGFLGAYLLHGLLSGSAADVYCLVRARSAEEGRERIARNLATYIAWDPAWEARVIPVVGDLGSPSLGLAEDAFSALAGRVDAVVHNGGVVNFTFPYARMRDANVLGTLEAVRLACEAGAALHFVSTLGVHLGESRQRVRITEASPLSDPAELHDAYTQTKWAADGIVRAAAERGLRTTIHRPARVGPDSRTGATNADDWFSRILRGMVETGTAPDLPWRLDLAPVEQVAAGILRAVRDPAAIGGVFHYFNPHFLPFAELAEAARDAGFPVAALPYGEWRARAMAAATGPEHPLYPLLPLFPPELKTVYAPAFESPRSEALLADAGVRWAVPDRAAVARTLAWFTGRGVLHAPAAAAAPNP